MSDFEPTQTLTYCTFSQLFMWIGASNDQYMSSHVLMVDSEQCLNRPQLILMPLLVNFVPELGHIMTKYDFLWARRFIF